MLRTFEKGSRTEAVVLSALAQAGYTVLLPFGVARYDLAIDDGSGKQIKTVQCKTGRLRDGGIHWATASVDRGTKRRTSYKGQVDYFGVWCPGFTEVYLVPVDEVGVAEGVLRLEPPRNKQTNNIRWARDYVIQPIDAGL